ncbi:MAG: DUF305 domain-containing protein [Pseudanabaena frigida]|uniref:DUF305 domain-containing protein n=1 Tax=Pseudanabaena frigida TaxID=945775 RepID=A0A2W4WKK6_9CYAN|nr:MAG: DUF305 domain-containing protein [Pseudanabaena frigida]
MNFTRPVKSNTKLGVLLHNLGLVAIASITTATLAACSPSTNSESSASSSPTAVTPSAKPITKPTPHNMGNMGSMAMDLGPADADFDLRFIDGMMPHHQGAIEMAKEAQQKSQRPEIKKLADEIIQAQTKEIEELKTWRKQWYASASDKPMAYDAKMGHMMDMSSEQKQGMMMSQDLGAKDAEFDLRFINAMIPHHEGAVVMANDALQKSKRSEITKLAKDIITSQQAEIDRMNQWRKAWYAK